MSKKTKKPSIMTAEAADNDALKEEIHKQSLKILKKLPALGPVLLLYMQSSHRRYSFIGDLEWLLMPPLVAGQCKLFMKEEYPTSFISWAFLSKEAEQRLFQNGGKLRPEDWNCGDRLWIIDIIAPFGGVEHMLHDLQTTEFPGRVLYLAAPDPKTGGVTARKLQPLKGTEVDGKVRKGKSGGTVH